MKNYGVPPCADCKPDLILDNAETFNIYQYCSSQLLLSADGQTVSLRMEAVNIALERFQCSKKSETLSKILSLSEQIIHFQNEKRKREEAKKGKK